MGKTSRPLTIVALPPADQWEELAKLEAQGHRIIRVVVGNADLQNSTLIGADIILGPNCWRMDTQHKPYLTLALKEARMLKYPVHEKRSDSKTRTRVAADLDSDINTSTE